MRYRSLIVFRLGGWSPLLPTGFLVSRGTLVPSRYLRLRLRGCHALWPRFPTVFSSAILTCRWPATPGVRRPLVWPLPSSLATTKGIEFSFFSSGYLDVSLPRVPSYETMNSSHGDRALPRPGSPIRTSTDRCMLTAPRRISLFAASFFASLCLGIRHTLFPTLPIWCLDHYFLLTDCFSVEFS